MTYENYTGEILVIRIALLNDYCFLTGNNEPFRVTRSTSSGQYRYSLSGGPALTTVLVF